MSKAMDEYEGEAKPCLSSDQSFQTKLSKVHGQVIHLEQGNRRVCSLTLATQNMWCCSRQGQNGVSGRKGQTQSCEGQCPS